MTGSLRFGYGTNGLADHRLGDAIAMLADLGYDGLALTLDHHHLDPYATGLRQHLDALAHRLSVAGLAVVIETGARYLLDPRRKHQPTLLSEQDSERRLDLLCRAVRIGHDLGAEAVSFWSGSAPPGLPDHVGWDRLLRGCAAVVDVADGLGVRVGFEPEPGMFVADLDGYDHLADRLGRPSALGLTLDIGHCRCLEAAPVADCVRRAGPQLVNVQIDDMRRGRHEHLEFGDGEIDFPPVLAALTEVGYRGLVSVELPRHSHAGAAVATRSLDFLRAAADACAAGPGKG